MRAQEAPSNKGTVPPPAVQHRPPAGPGSCLPPTCTMIHIAPCPMRSVGLRVGALSAAFFSTELLLRVYDGERRPRQTAWAGAGAGALYGLATNVGLPSGDSPQHHRGLDEHVGAASCCRLPFDLPPT